ncbi:geranylgeranylglycerol-phosphate geranylgeranyltransferase [Flavobacterium sp. MAH-1]|uniref:Geranylgeranylglycerol-phosphate geranylgeranyltransferase n=1 Tax=Flavobacterium agri TaxID=2743471 RepID=A0A7Y8XZJ1_9FLAO|nr:geranylgeranylglycerol-phosphate geranylgeranyltransferase [Flavobacterium agri]NUY79782.1 geranylgeranylglycerol-phosphate geranylgeranyltransferase [Flavobacterium agri]NYA69807.1 geranylgeranylglycerol-phosphate geranylgeranyltransferase [Flavobacterium agri]
MNYLRLIRYQNLLMLALMQLIVHFGFLRQQNIALALSDLNAVLLVLATVLVAAGGYVINNLQDVATDLENKPDDVVIGKGISESTGYNLYFGLTISGVALGYYVAYEIDRWGFATAFILVGVVLYAYANFLKRTLLAGNIAIALLTGFSVLIVGIFDLVPTLEINDRPLVMTVFGILSDYAIFTVIINLIREIVKDLEDVNGDYNQGMNTLPIALGVTRTAKIASVLGVVAFSVLAWYIYAYIFALTFATLYALIFLISPLAFFSIKVWSGKKQKDFAQMSLLLKIIIFFGILSIAVITLNMKYNA